MLSGQEGSRKRKGEEQISSVSSKISKPLSSTKTDSTVLCDATPTTSSSTKKKVVVTKRIVRRKDGTIISTTTTKKVTEVPTDDNAVVLSSPQPTALAQKFQDSTKPAKMVKKTGWDWYKSIGSPRWILSPMVGQSELPFRLLCRNHHVQLAYTPMFIASRFVQSEAYRNAVWQTCPEDRPLVVQFCANDPETLVKAAKMVQNKCDAIDINLGCPQEVARRGGYGSYLMDNLPLVEQLVKAASTQLDVPVTVKIRIFDSFKKTVAYTQMLEKSGASLITIHGRQRHHREEVLADWTAADRLRNHLNIPVIVNGDLWHAEDIAMCMDQTNVDGYMSAQGILHNPALFEPLALAKEILHAQPEAQHENHVIANASSFKNDQFNWVAPVTESSLRQRRPVGAIMSHALSFAYNHPLNKSEASLRPNTKGQIADAFRTPFSTPEDAERQFDLAAEYVDLLRKYPVCHPSIARRHIFFMLFDNFQANLDQYDMLCDASECSEYERIIVALRTRAIDGKTYKVKETYGEGQKPRSRRRDGTIAPPAWPIGGGGMNAENSEKNQKKNKNKPTERGSDPYDAVDDGFEVIGKSGTKTVKKNDDSKNKNSHKSKKSKNNLTSQINSSMSHPDNGLDQKRLKNIDLSKFD